MGGTQWVGLRGWDSVGGTQWMGLSGWDSVGGTQCVGLICVTFEITSRSPHSDSFHTICLYLYWVAYKHTIFMYVYCAVYKRTRLVARTLPNDHMVMNSISHLKGTKKLSRN